MLLRSKMSLGQIFFKKSKLKKFQKTPAASKTDVYLFVKQNGRNFSNNGRNF